MQQQQQPTAPASDESWQVSSGDLSINAHWELCEGVGGMLVAVRAWGGREYARFVSDAQWASRIMDGMYSFIARKFPQLTQIDTKVSAQLPERDEESCKQHLERVVFARLTSSESPAIDTMFRNARAAYALLMISAEACQCADESHTADDWAVRLHKACNGDWVRAAQMFEMWKTDLQALIGPNKPDQLLGVYSLAFTPPANSSNAAEKDFVPPSLDNYAAGIVSKDAPVDDPPGAGGGSSTLEIATLALAAIALAFVIGIAIVVAVAVGRGSGSRGLTTSVRETAAIQSSHPLQ